MDKANRKEHTENNNDNDKTPSMQAKVQHRITNIFTKVSIDENSF